MVDPILIEQVVLNLLKNAAEAIDSAQLPPARRHIELRVVPRHTPDEGGVIEFSVTDMGPGLKDEVIARLYEAFFSTKAEGLGIGLSLCRSIVESHRGRMRAQNLYNGELDRRVPFLVHLAGGTAARSDARTRPPSAPTAERATPSATPAAISRMSLIPKKGTVYVVDDDEAVRDSLQWLLEGKDYRVKCFDSSESFLSRFDPREVACLIADIRMDGMSGLELQDRLLERKSPLPVVFITGHGDVPMAVTTMKKGAMDFIEKPFKEEELLGLVERMLDQARSAFSQHQEQASRDALLSRLTTREAQVLERIVAGRLNKQIADDLGISIKTVEAHRANIMEKLNANTVADLLKIALGAQQPRPELLPHRRGRTPRAAAAASGLVRLNHAKTRMTAQLIDGNALSDNASAPRWRNAPRRWPRAAAGPGLAVILVGDDPASAVYVRNKVKACARARPALGAGEVRRHADRGRRCWRASRR